MWMRPVTLSALYLGALLLAFGPVLGAGAQRRRIWRSARELVSASRRKLRHRQHLPGPDGRRSGGRSLTRPEIAKDLDEVLKALGPDLELQKQQAVTLAARSYAKWLTEPEIRDALTFFKSAVRGKIRQGAARSDGRHHPVDHVLVAARVRIRDGEDPGGDAEARAHRCSSHRRWSALRRPPFPSGRS